MSAEDRTRYPQVPASTATVGMWLFLAALFMLFAAGLVGYVVIRVTHKAGQPVHIPGLLWLSTALVLCVSVCLSRALGRLRREKQTAFLIWVRAALVMGLGFLAVQAPAMVMLLTRYEHLPQQRRISLYGLLFFLILIHALHVVGGMVALVIVNVRGRQGIYDHEHYLPVRHAAMYWHFLDAIWLAMFLTFLATA